jgi:hypothetical protein
VYNLMLVFVFTMLLAAHQVYIKGQVGGEDADNNAVTPPSKATADTAKSFQPTAQQVTSAADYHAPAYHADPPGVMRVNSNTVAADYREIAQV